MSQATEQKEVLKTLSGLRRDVDDLKQDIHRIMKVLEDTLLTNEEKKLVSESIAKIETGNTKDFVSHESLKKELGF